MLAAQLASQKEDVQAELAAQKKELQKQFGDETKQLRADKVEADAIVSELDSSVKLLEYARDTVSNRVILC